jgi:hypothetical protein
MKRLRDAKPGPSAGPTDKMSFLREHGDSGA